MPAMHACHARLHAREGKEGPTEGGKEERAQKSRRKKRQPAMVTAIHFGEGRKERMKTEGEKKKGTKEKAIPN